MLKYLKSENKLKEFIFLGILSLLCFIFSLFRYYYTNSIAFLFLNWNLFLAFLPWLFSNILVLFPQISRKIIFKLILLFLWLLFLPNAFYIITDLFHLQIKLKMPVWFNLILILSFAWTGILFGVLSIWNIEKVFAEKYNKAIIKIISVILLFIVSLGVYIGRYLRWNSWDIFQSPLFLINDTCEIFFNPLTNINALGMIVFIGVFLNIIYWSLYFIKDMFKKT